MKTNDNMFVLNKSKIIICKRRISKPILGKGEIKVAISYPVRFSLNPEKRKSFPEMRELR